MGLTNYTIREKVVWTLIVRRSEDRNPKALGSTCGIYLFRNGKEFKESRPRWLKTPRWRIEQSNSTSLKINGRLQATSLEKLLIWHNITKQIQPSALEKDNSQRPRIPSIRPGVAVEGLFTSLFHYLFVTNSMTFCCVLLCLFSS